MQSIGEDQLRFNNKNQTHFKDSAASLSRSSFYRSEQLEHATGSALPALTPPGDQHFSAKLALLGNSREFEREMTATAAHLPTIEVN